MIFQIDHVDLLGRSLKVVTKESQKRGFEVQFRVESNGIFWAGFELTPEQARKLAGILEKMADECDKANEELDNHPDAVTARKYMAGDPETIKRLHIFDP